MQELTLIDYYICDFDILGYKEKIKDADELKYLEIIDKAISAIIEEFQYNLPDLENQNNSDFSLKYLVIMWL